MSFMMQSRTMEVRFRQGIHIVCYIPQKRKGTLEKLLENQGKQNRTIKKQNRIIDALQTKALNNCIVQLNAKVVSVINNATSLYPGRHQFRFEDVVLEDPRVDQETKDHLKHDPTYAALNRIMNHQFWMWMVVRTRNNEAHSPYIYLKEIEMMLNQVEPGLRHLSPISQRAFSAAKDVYEKVKSIDELDELVKIFYEAYIN